MTAVGQIDEGRPAGAALPVGATTLPPGLSEREVAERRARGQGNTAPPATGRTYREIVTDNLFTFINLGILVLGILLAALGRPIDALVSAGTIVVNGAVSIWQEVKAKRTLDRIALLNRPTPTVLRDGQERTVRPEELVVGDVIRVGPGDQIVVDGAMVGPGRLAVDESQLTGESDLIPKAAGDKLFSGSFCVNGTGYFEVERVGGESFANQLTAGARAHRRIYTPLQRQVDLVIRILLLLVVYIEIMLVIEDLVLQVNLGEAVEHAALVAGLVPNGLLVSIAVAYAVAAVQLSRSGALVQQSNAIESLSNVDVLCLDKTGTLTANRLAVDGLVPLADTDEALRRTLGAMVASMAAGNKTSEAIAAAYPAEARRADGEVPFSSARKWSAVALADGDLRGVYALGAPEMLRPYLGADDAAWLKLQEQARLLTDQGLRVLLVAGAPGATGLEDRGDDSRLPAGMAPLGLVSLSDELRPEAKETLAAFRASGVEPKVISGDNPETVAALARQAGLGPDIALFSGLDLAAMDEAQFRAAAVAGTIFGRITPEQKQHLVRALRAEGRYVAMIGDGVNDVLSLKQAQVGIAMQSGTQATRGVADIVLTNDSFAALLPAVREGQRVVNGMTDILKLFLVRILIITLVIVSSQWLGDFPLDLRQASLIALIVAGIPTTLLVLWARPGPTAASSMLPRLFHFVLPPVLVGGLLGLAVLVGVFMRNILPSANATPPLAPDLYLAAERASLLEARTALTMFLTFIGILLIVFVEPPTRWWVGGDSLAGDWRPTWLALALAAFFVATMAIPIGRDFYDLVVPHPLDVAIVAAAVLLWLVLTRWLWRRRLLERFLGSDDSDPASQPADTPGVVAPAPVAAQV